MIQVENYRARGGVVPKLAALRGVATHLRVIGRQTSAPLSEPLLFGVAGGIGVAYTSPRGPDGQLRPHLDLGARYRSRPGESLLHRRGRVRSAVIEVAERGLREALTRDEPVIAFVSAAALPFLYSPGGWADERVRAVVVCGLNGDDADEVVVVVDLGSKPIGVPIAAFRDDAQKARPAIAEPSDGQRGRARHGGGPAQGDRGRSARLL